MNLGKSVKKKPKIVTSTAGGGAIVAASTPKTSNTSTTTATITPTAISTPISVSTKKDELDLSAKVNNIVMASNALPHGTNRSFSNTNCNVFGRISIRLSYKSALFSSAIG